MRITLVGNPNVGKSTVFNRLTGAQQQVGNWSGKTVEMAHGTLLCNGQVIELVDLPGTYGLSAYSQEELVTRQYLLEHPSDRIILILDARSLERNLYLALEVIELTGQVVIGLNMVEKAQDLGLTVDSARMADALGVPVCEINAATGSGLDQLVQEAVKKKRSPQSLLVPYPQELELALKAGTKLIEQQVGERARWLALKRLSGENSAAQDEQSELLIQLLIEQQAAEGWTPERFELAFADAKYRFVSVIMRDCVREDRRALGWTNRIDSWVLSPGWGYLILAVVLAAIFLLSFVVSAPLGGLVGDAMAALGGKASAALAWLQAPALGQSLVKDGIFAGVGAVMGILPQVAVFYLLFALLQESGYLARVAFLGDRFMRIWGLPGKAFFPLISSYGCNVPGVMAARTLEDKRDRLITMLVVPLVPCIPRLGVMSAIVGVFFPGIRGAFVMLSLLLLDLVLLVFSARLLRKTLLRSAQSAFVMELPHYQLPSIRQIVEPAWQQTVSFLKKVWTYVLIASIVVWGLSSFPTGVPVQDTWAGLIGTWLEGLGQYLGFDWRIMVALLFGFTAKETTLSTLGILYGVTDGTAQSIAAALAQALSPLGVYTFLAVYMLYVPCLSTVITIYKESGSWKWTGLGIAYDLVLGFSVGWLIWHGGQLILALL